MARADREHLLPDDPMNAKNRRLSIILLTEIKDSSFQTLKNSPSGTSESLFKEKQQTPPTGISTQP
jgi:hypothetical protein